MTTAVVATKATAEGYGCNEGDSVVDDSSGTNGCSEGSDIGHYIW